MVKKSLIAIVAVAAAATLSSGFMSHELCEGFVPENDMHIPEGVVFSEGGITEQEFHRVLDRAEGIYASIVQAEGGVLDLKRRWSDGTVNASAQRIGDTYVVNMYGGLARHPAITSDGFALVVCHELGHHLGGAPKIGGWWNVWASNEGQSDYYSSLKCLRRVFPTEENLEYVKHNEVDDYTAEKCSEVFSTEDDQALCMRSSMAGMSVSALFQDLRKEEQAPRFDTPDPRKVSSTDDTHPGTQCRLDTYFQGALCDKEIADELDDDNYVAGACARVDNYENGVRPRCWFQPGR